VDYRTLVIDAPFLTRRAWEAAGPGDGRLAPEEHARRVMVGASLSTILALARRYRPAQIYLALEAQDESSGCARRDFVPGYKADRPPPPPAYLDALADFTTIAGFSGLWFAHSRWEADDVAAAIACGWPGPHLLWSADKDWIQLVGPNVHLVRPDTRRRPKDVPPKDWHREEKLITPETMLEVTRIAPASAWTEVLALKGDKTDGVDGLPDVGLVRARALHLACPGIVEMVIARRDDEVRGKVAAFDASMTKWAELAIMNREALRLSLEAVRLRSDADEIGLKLEEPASGHLLFEALRGWLRPMGLESYLGPISELLLPPEEPDSNDELPF
jgi:5'-3' exonuclease